MMNPENVAGTVFFHADGLAWLVGVAAGRATLRRFPDGESYVRVESDVAGRDTVVVASLARPDEKLLPLLFLAGTLRDCGARRIGLVAPYLAYLRQDRRFHPGEALTSRDFAELLSAHFDWLVTVDPHLHRYRSLGEIYTIPTRVVRAAPLLAAWIGEHVERPLIVGPDVESAQWVGEVAAHVAAPHVVLEKLRRGDRDVEIRVPDLGGFRAYTPVLVDDIISTGRTMIETVRRLRAETVMPAPVCMGVHAVLAEGAHEGLLAAGAARVVTTNTIPHTTNAIDVRGLLVAAVGDLAAR